MSFSSLPQELVDIIVGFSDKDTCKSLSRVCSCLRAPSQRKVLDMVYVSSTSPLEDLLELMQQSKNKELARAIAGRVKFTDVVVDMHELSEFFMAQTMIITNAEWHLPDSPAPISKIPSHYNLSRLTTLIITISAFPLHALYAIKSLKNLELWYIGETGPDVDLDDPLPERPRLEALKIGYNCQATMMYPLLFRVLNCTSLKSLESYTDNKIDVPNKDGAGVSSLHLHSILLDAARMSLETVSIIFLECDTEPDYAYDWKQVPNMKHFKLKITQHPGESDISPEIKESSTAEIHQNLLSIAKSKPEKLESIHLILTDVYEYGPPIDLLSRCDVALEEWKEIGETLVDISKCRSNGHLHVHINLHHYGYWASEVPYLYEGGEETIKTWFATHVLTTSELDTHRIVLEASITDGSLIEYTNQCLPLGH